MGLDDFSKDLEKKKIDDENKRTETQNLQIKALEDRDKFQSAFQTLYKTYCAEIKKAALKIDSEFTFEVSEDVIPQKGQEFIHEGVAKFINKTDSNVKEVLFKVIGDPWQKNITIMGEGTNVRNMQLKPFMAFQGSFEEALNLNLEDTLDKVLRKYYLN